MPCHWMHIEPAGLFRKEFDRYQNLHLNPEYQSCIETCPVGDITLENWLAKGTTTDISLSVANPLFPNAYYNPEEDWFYTKKEANSLPAAKKNYKFTLYGEVRRFGYQLGTKGVRKSKYWWFHKHFFSGPDLLERYEAFYDEFGKPWESEIDPKREMVKETKNKIKEMEEYGFPHALCGKAPHHFEGMWGGFGPNSIAKLARKRPTMLKKICKRYQKICLNVERLNLEAGHQIIKTGDDLGQKGRGLISPKLYKEFFLPCLKARCNLAHKYDAVIYMHSCGFIEEYLDYFLEAGLDGIQSLEVMAGNDLSRIREIVRDNMCLIGGLDSSRIMTFGTPQECKQHVKKQIQAAKTLNGEIIPGGYIPGPAHDLLDTPLENVNAIRNAISKNCSYPL